MSNCVLCRSRAQPNPLVIENLEELVGFDKDKFENLQHIPEVRSLSLGKNMESVVYIYNISFGDLERYLMAIAST